MSDWYEQYKTFQNSQWTPTVLPPEEEANFKKWLTNSRWFNEIKADIERHEGKVDGERLFTELTGPQADYDYRGAWRSGIGAQDYEYDHRMHWPSSTGDGRMLKSPRHPTAWMEYFMEETGKDPNEMGLKTAEEARQYTSSASYEFDKAFKEAVTVRSRGK